MASPKNITSQSRRRFTQGSLALLAGCQSMSQENRWLAALPEETILVDAPFPMPPIRVPNFALAKAFDIRDYGAQTGNKHANNQAIALAISNASKQGGRVIIPAGVWLCGAIHLKSNVNLHLESGSVLLFSQDPGDYLPAVKTSWEGMECYNYSPLIYAYNCHHIAITGKGTLKALLDIWQDWYARPEAHMNALANLYHMAAQNVAVEARQMVYEGANLRPHFVQFNRCHHVLVEGIHIQDSPFWVLHPYLCTHVVIRRVSVSAHGHNNDGVDPEMTQNMLIEDCIFDQGDDAIALKSGRNQDAWRLNTPSKNIVMRNCRIKQAHQLLAVGSELSGGIENIFVDNCHFDGFGTIERDDMGNIVFIKTNERRGGTVNNVIVQNITAPAIGGGVLAIATDVLYQWKDLVPTYERRLTKIDNIRLENIQVGKARFISDIDGQAELPIGNVVLKNVTVSALTDAAHRHMHVLPVTII